MKTERFKKEIPKSELQLQLETALHAARVPCHATKTFAVAIRDEILQITCLKVPIFTFVNSRGAYVGAVEPA